MYYVNARYYNQLGYNLRIGLNTFEKEITLYTRETLPTILANHSIIAYCFVPEYASITRKTNVFTTHTIYIDYITNINGLDLFNDHNFCINAVKINGSLIRYAKQQTYLLSKLAISNAWLAVKYITHLTNDICIDAIYESNGKAIQYMNQTPELCAIAVQCDGLALQYVIYRTQELCKLAIEQNGSALQWVKNQTQELCELAVQNNESAIEYVKNITEDICLKALASSKQSGIAIKYLENQTEEICIESIKKNINNLEFVKNKTPKICNIAIETNYIALRMLDQNEELCIKAVKINYLAITLVRNQTEAICIAAIHSNFLAMKYITIKTDAFYEAAAESYNKSIQAI